jgi:hypothetical protein
MVEDALTRLKWAGQETMGFSPQKVKNGTGSLAK